MTGEHEYKVEQIDWAFFWVRGHAIDAYKEGVDRYANDGWRLVEKSARRTGFWSVTRHLDLILEREV